MRPLLFLVALGFLGLASGAVIANSVNFVVEPATYQSKDPFSLICTVDVMPKDGHYGVSFVHNGTTLGTYMMNGLWAGKEVDF